MRLEYVYMLIGVSSLFINIALLVIFVKLNSKGAGNYMKTKSNPNPLFFESQINKQSSKLSTQTNDLYDPNLSKVSRYENKITNKQASSNILPDTQLHLEDTEVEVQQPITPNQR